MVSVAIDGPAGAGKSTIARCTAERLGYIYVDTGALYRAIGFFAIQNGADCKNEQQLNLLLPSIKLDLQFVDGVQKVLLNGEDVSQKIRTPEASMAASDVSALPCVREFLLDRQREIAGKNNVIMDGRDIGTVVLPHAAVKIFLTASPEARAKRRFLELQQKKINGSYENVLQEMRRRDEQDTNRKIAPLKPAADSVILDTTGYALEESVELVMKTIKEKLL